MTSLIRIEDDASADLEAAAVWYESERIGLGRRFYDAAQSQMIEIARDPLVYRVLYKGLRKAGVPHFPYRIYFLVEEEVVFIIAVLHTARHPRVWRERLRRYQAKGE